MPDNEPDYVTLKWGTIKSYSIHDEDTWKLMEAYFDAGPVTISAMAQRDTPEQKEILCQIIDQIGRDVYLEWDGEYVSTEKAKDYVRSYK